MGRTLIVLGLGLVAIGVLVLALAKIGLPLGRLPGDLSYRGKAFRFYAPLGTSLLLSIIISLILYLLTRFRR